MIRPIREGRADMVLGSRMLTPGGAKRGGMPLWKRVANRFLTTVENLAMGRQFAECHTGYRAYSRHFLETVPFLRNSNGFVFDTEVIFQAVHFDLPVVEVPVESRYFEDASSVGFRQGVVYGLGTLWTAPASCSTAGASPPAKSSGPRPSLQARPASHSEELRPRTGDEESTMPYGPSPGLCGLPRALDPDPGPSE